MDSNNIYANVTPTPVQEPVPEAQGTNQQPVYQQTVDTQNAYQQTVYQQPVYQQPTPQQVDPQAVYQQPPYVAPTPEYDTGVKCPGKEITGMILGINALVWSVLGAMFCWMPLYGIIFGTLYPLMGIGCGVAANILHKKVLEQATVTTKKIHIGKKLATAGIIVGAVSIGLAIMFLIIWIAAGVGFSKLGRYSYYY